MSIFWIIFFIASIAFIVLYYVLFKATVRQPEEMSKEFAMVYAGTPDEDHQGASPININLTTSAFLDEQGRPVKVDEYDGYVVSGNSMELANIKDRNLLLVHKNDVFSDSTPLPGIFVLRREHPLTDQGKYKLRRIWAVAYLGETDLENMIRGIMTHPEFMQLKKNTELCLDDDQMLLEFVGNKGRLDIYKDKHPHWKKSGSEENKVVISTTLRTECGSDIKTATGRHISFSIHPANLVVGKVAYAYSMQ